MHIVFEHPHVLPVTRYGGTERFLFWHMKELVRQGHRVTLVGHPGSSALAEFGITVVPRGPGESWLEKLPKQADLLHLFSSPPSDRELPYPVVATIEGNGRPGETFHPNTIFVSRKHAENHGAVCFVHNGIDLAEYPFEPPARIRAWDDFMFLAKAKWKVKNLDDCIRACRSQRKRLHVAGGRRLLWSRYVKFYGMADQALKREILARSNVLLFPVRWHEPFGIAVIEAMAAGLPVLCSPFGSLPEIVSRPEVGQVCASYAEFEAAVREAPRTFEPRKIRQYVQEEFAIAKVTARYVRLYEKALGGESLNPGRPRTVEGFVADALLPF